MNFLKSVFVSGLMMCAFVVTASAAKSAGNLVAEGLLAQGGLESSWQISLPLKSGERLDSLYVFGDYLYALTSNNFFFNIDRKTGSVRSLISLAVPGLPIVGPMHFDNKSVFLIGQELKLFNPGTGVIERTLKLEHIGGNYGGIARNKKYVYICGSDSRLYAYQADEELRVFMVTADNDSPIFSVTASDSIVWFGTSAGNIVAIKPDSPEKLWQFDMTGQLKSPLELDADAIYFAGMDTKLYKLNAATGKQAWNMPYYTGDKIDRPLIMGKSFVYVNAPLTGLHAVDKQTGKNAWVLPGGVALLAESGSTAFAYVRPGSLSVMENNTGKEIVSINIAGVNRYAVNQADSMVYLATDKGQIQAASCISQKSQPQPVETKK